MAPPPHATLKFADDDESIQGDGHLFSFNDVNEVGGSNGSIANTTAITTNSSRRSDGKYTWISENGSSVKPSSNWASTGHIMHNQHHYHQIPQGGLMMTNDIIQQQQNAYNSLMFHQQQFSFPVINGGGSSISGGDGGGNSVIPGMSSGPLLTTGIHSFPHHFSGVKQSNSLSGKKCSNCKTGQTPSWRRCPEGKALLCNACGLYHKLHGKSRPFVVQEDGIIRIERTPTFKREN